jgi:hypothetical protein
VADPPWRAPYTLASFGTKKPLPVELGAVKRSAPAGRRASFAGPLLRRFTVSIYSPLRRFEALGGARHTSARTHVCTAPGCEVSLVNAVFGVAPAWHSYPVAAPS